MTAESNNVIYCVVRTSELENGTFSADRSKKLIFVRVDSIRIRENAVFVDFVGVGVVFSPTHVTHRKARSTFGSDEKFVNRNLSQCTSNYSRLTFVVNFHR